MVNSIYLKRPTKYQIKNGKFKPHFLVTPYRALVCGVIPKSFSIDTCHLIPLCNKQTQQTVQLKNYTQDAVSYFESQRSTCNTKLNTIGEILYSSSEAICKIDAMLFLFYCEKVMLIEDFQN